MHTDLDYKIYFLFVQTRIVVMKLNSRKRTHMINIDFFHFTRKFRISYFLLPDLWRSCFYMENDVCHTYYMCVKWWNTKSSIIIIGSARIMKIAIDSLCCRLNFTLKKTTLSISIQCELIALEMSDLRIL